MRLRIAFAFLALTVLLCACSGSDKDAFRNVDHDKDGKISYEELLFVFPDVTPDVFSHFDTNGDGVISPDEYAIFLKEESAKAAKAQDAAKTQTPAQSPAAGTTQSSAPYSGEEVIEIPAPGSDQPASKSRSDKGSKAQKDAKAKTDAAATRSEAIQYTIQRGDNLTRLAHKFGVSVEAITKANGDMRPDTLRDGQVLTIPPRP